MKSTMIVLAVCVPLVAAEWKLVWQDEFDGSGSPDAKKWSCEEGYIRNHEAQLYTCRPANVRLENGLLVVEGRKERIPNPAYLRGATAWQKSREMSEYTSGSIRTLGKADWRYGRFEAKAKLPTGRGTWPAIWMLGANCGNVGWPRCGEIDIMENVGFDPNVIHANIHTAAYNHVAKTNKGAKVTIENPFKDFHIYAVEWTPEKMDFSVDGKKYFTYINEKTGTDVWPFDAPFYVILNVAIGGSWGGQRGIDDTIFPQRMEVDYVRVYQRN